MPQRLSDSDLGDILADCLTTAGCPAEIRQRLHGVLGELLLRRKPFKFKRGDAVRRKGTGLNGLVMNIEQPGDSCHCTWTTDRGQQHAFLPEDALEFATSHVDSEL